MRRDIERFSQGRYDVLVIGGGINGAAIAHLAALRGLKVALLEKNDFASGTSSKSTKLIHGGLRYLENFEFGLVREALKERFIQLKNAPHLVKPLSFVIPVYKSDPKPFWMVKFGVWLYDFLSGPYLIKRHHILKAGEVLERVPGLKKDGLCGGVMYYDAQMDDARLCLENILSADAKGAHVANYVEVKDFMKEGGKVVGAEAYDVLGQKGFQVYARHIVVAVGPWTNRMLEKENGPASRKGKVRATKGVHIIYRGQISQHALLIPTSKDQRVFFVIPWMGHALIGTTDTDFGGDPDCVKADEQDIDYLFEELRRVFPKKEFQKKDIITTFAGLRPLVYQKGSPAKVSRKHVITKSLSGIWYVMGGKYTTYRKIAAETLAKLMPQAGLAGTGNAFPLYGSGEIKEGPVNVGQRYKLKADVIESLMALYGVRYRDVLALTEKDPSLAAPICSCTQAIRAQVVYAIATEMARQEEDIVLRRLSLHYRDCPTKHCRQEIHRILSHFTGRE